MEDRIIEIAEELMDRGFTKSQAAIMAASVLQAELVSDMATNLHDLYLAMDRLGTWRNNDDKPGCLEDIASSLRKLIDLKTN
jgi:hypothetical protein